ncbi:MAP kinase-activated protein kinase 2 (Fragment) [Seminavis robusta]|uniref:MAP kinase-activated protein kinase 2 n=1 Tax=Seminavis robusta TaxID=568900 RepID=A0A9N8HSJ7_9STRA
MVAPPDSSPNLVENDTAATLVEEKDKDKDEEMDCCYWDPSAENDEQIQKCIPSCTCSCSAYGKVCPASAMLAGKAAVAAVKKLRENSVLFANKDCMSLDKRLTLDDLTITDTKLGEGGFCVVKACTVKQQGNQEEDPKPLAIKFLKRRTMANRKQFAHGASDLAQEAYFLHALKGHPNILNLHAVKAGNLASNVMMAQQQQQQDCDNYGFFITVDRLYSTLEQKLDEWRKQQHDQKKEPLFAALLMSAEQKQHKKEQFQQRLQIAIDIATAVQFLHQKRVVFRDLKPDNIGFDKDGTLKLFDFGLAKELKPNESHADGRYQLTGNTGSRRYMAPEVAKELPYNQSVDVYSFGILLHELLSGEKPFYGYSSGKHMSLVVMGGERPHMDKHWPMNLQWLMKRCWNPVPTSRPDFDVILQTLQEVLDQSTKHNNHHHHQEQQQTCSSPEGSTQFISAATSPPTSPSKNKLLLEPPIGGFAALLRPNRGARRKSHGSHDVPPASPPPLPSPQPAKKGISLGSFFSRK